MSAKLCDNPDRVLPTKQAHLNLVSGICLGAGHVSVEHACGWPYFFSSGQADYVWPKVLTVNNIASINYLARAKAPGVQRHSYQEGYSKGLELVKGYSFLWNVQDLNKSDY